MTTIEYYFDILPLHPVPQRRESLTSYVTRVAEANSIQSISELSKIIGVNAATLKNLSDYSLQTLGDFAERTACPEEKILTTTLFHMGKKFHRLKNSTSFAKFFKGSLCSYLRYCPECIAENLYYALPWRFLALSGCNRHRIKFLEYCGHCRSILPLLSIHLTIGICSVCRRDLRLCKAQPLSEQEQQLVHSRALDLEYLLSPDPCENDDHIAKWIGYRFAVLRREKQISISTIADQIAIPEHEIMTIEQGGIYKYALFSEYMRYADYFGVTLQHIFQGSSMVFQQEGQISIHKFRQFLLRQHEGVVLEHLLESIKDLAAQGKMVTQTTIMRHMHTDSKTLNQYASVEALWKQILSASQDERHKEKIVKRQKKGEALCEQVKKSVVALHANGQQPSREAISEIMSLSLTILLSYPQVKILLMQYPRRVKRALPDEDYIIEQVNKAIEYARYFEKRISKTEITKLIRHLGISINRLKAYPRVETIVESVKSGHFRPPMVEPKRRARPLIELNAEVADTVQPRVRLRMGVLCSTIG